MKALYAIIRTEALAFEALDAIVCTESLAVQDVSRHRSYGSGDLGAKAVSVTRPSVGLKAHANVRTGSLGVQNVSRHRSYWEPWR